MLATAYNVEYFQISSKIPLDKERFDLTAKLPPGTTEPQFRSMLQHLLAERFHLKLRFESEDFPGYELVVAKSGPKITASVPDAPQSSAPQDDRLPTLPPNVATISSKHTLSGGFQIVGIRAQQQPLSSLADFFELIVPPPVVNRTGLTGKYTFTLLCSHELPRTDIPDPPGVPSIFVALQQQLGLQLVSKKIPMDQLIIEQLDRSPTEN